MGIGAGDARRQCGRVGVPQRKMFNEAVFCGKQALLLSGKEAGGLGEMFSGVAVPQGDRMSYGAGKHGALERQAFYRQGF